MGPQTNMMYIWWHQDTLQKQIKIPKHLGKYYFCKAQKTQIVFLEMLEKTGIGKSWRSVLNCLENMEYVFNLFQKTWHANVVIWYIGSSKPWNFDTGILAPLKLRNQGTKKPRNQEANTPRHFFYLHFRGSPQASSYRLPKRRKTYIFQISSVPTY